MSTVQIDSNPFALLMDPQSVLDAVARSERLARLHSRVWRPLDKPVTVVRDGAVASADQAVDDAADRAEDSIEPLDSFDPLAPL